MNFTTINDLRAHIVGTCGDGYDIDPVERWVAHIAWTDFGVRSAADLNAEFPEDSRAWLELLDEAAEKAEADAAEDALA